MKRVNMYFTYDFCHCLCVLLLTGLPFVMLMPQAMAAGSDKEYLYFRDVTIAPYQNMREFFDLPDRRGRYEIHVISEAMAPLTLKLIRLRGEEESVFVTKRSFHLGDHQFKFHFSNPTGKDDLAIEVANSNPTMAARASMIIIEETDNR